jgi:hypothetical protein
MSATAKKKKKKPKKEEKKKKGNTKAGAATTKRPKTPDTDTDVSGEIKLARLAQPIDVHTGENDEPEATPEGEPQSTKNLGSGRKYALKRSAALLFALQHTDFYFTCIDPVNKLPYISIVPASEPLVEHLLNNPVLESTVPSNIVTLIKTGLVLHDNLGSIRVVDEVGNVWFGRTPHSTCF